MSGKRRIRPTSATYKSPLRKATPLGCAGRRQLQKSGRLCHHYLYLQGIHLIFLAVSYEDGSIVAAGQGAGIFNIRSKNRYPEAFRQFYLFQGRFEGSGLRVTVVGIALGQRIVRFLLFPVSGAGHKRNRRTGQQKYALP